MNISTFILLLALAAAVALVIRKMIRDKKNGKGCCGCGGGCNGCSGCGGGLPDNDHK